MAPIAERKRIRSLSGLGPGALLDDRTHHLGSPNAARALLETALAAFPQPRHRCRAAQGGDRAPILSAVRPLSMSAFNCAAVGRPSLECAGGATGGLAV